MARIWYSVVKFEHELANGETLMAGAIFTVQRLKSGMIGCNALYGNKLYVLPADLCKQIMTKPTLDTNSAHEEAIMLCEAAYC